MFKWNSKKKSEDSSRDASYGRKQSLSHPVNSSPVQSTPIYSPATFDTRSNYSKQSSTSSRQTSQPQFPTYGSANSIHQSDITFTNPVNTPNTMRLVLPSDIPGNPGHIAWVCQADRSTHDFFISHCSLEPDRTVCRNLANMLNSLQTYPPSNQTAHSWFDQYCSSASYKSPEHQVRNIREALLKTKVVILFISDKSIQLIKQLGAGESVDGSSMLLEWEIALSLQKHLLICPIFVGREDFNIGASFKFNSYDVSLIPNVFHLHPNSNATGTIRDTVADVFALKGPAVMPDQMDLLRSHFEGKLREWHEMASSQITPVNNPPSVSPITRSKSFSHSAADTMSINPFSPAMSTVQTSASMARSTTSFMPSQSSFQPPTFQIPQPPQQQPPRDLLKLTATQSKIAPITHQQLVKRQFTWSSLDEAILNGEKLIVGAGRFVYDISTWIPSHPGGSVILYGALGTDVTQDYFNESPDFDKASFFPQKEAPKQNQRKSNFNSTWQRTGTLNSQPSIASQSSYDSSDSLSENAKNVATLSKELRGNRITSEDWNLILKARRIHAHSAQAMAKIANFLVGEIVPGPETAEVPDADEESLLFDPYEYRRYALTKKTLLTSIGSTKTPVYLMRFCILFPHTDKRLGEPESDFLPGQGVEIQARLNNKSIVSRYFLPIRGNTTCFEIIVKCTPNGAMSSYLSASKVGTKQYKIRGPFGAPLVPLNTLNSINIRQTMPHMNKSHLRMLQGSKENFHRLIYIGAGIGIVPMLQILSESILCIGKIRYAHNAYRPEIADEMELKAGDGVFVEHLYGDGWGYGKNTRTAQEGAFPASLLIPGCGIPPTTGAKFVIINCVHSLADIVGLQAFIPAILTYPDIIEIRHLVSSTVCTDGGVSSQIPKGTVVEPIPAAVLSDSDFFEESASKWESNPEAAVRRFGGTVEFGKLNVDSIERLIGNEYDWMEQTTEVFGGPEILICGPSSFEQTVYETLVDELGVDHTRITLIPPHTFANPS
ncbi:hypothetical protein HK098_008345 [Nowakowskiella sp. JEL0407]|nr:hypothetical protein HK098_008345 [Nowakowskiella sp. JEL0407]